MKRTARRLVALVGAAVLLVLALAAGPAAALTRSDDVPGRPGHRLRHGEQSADGRFAHPHRLLSAAAIALVAGVALAVDRRSRQRLAAVEGPAENAGQVCDDVVCEWHPSRPEVEERKAA